MNEYINILWDTQEAVNGLGESPYIAVSIIIKQL